MSDLISRADAIEVVQDHFNDDGFKGYLDGQKIMERIKALPSATEIKKKQIEVGAVADGIYGAETSDKRISNLICGVETSQNLSKPNNTCEVDLISRANAIRWVKTECNPYGKPTLEFESGKKVIEHLEQMPSTEPKMKWIPCSERLPSITNGEVLATTMWGEITIADRFSMDKWFIHEGNSNAVTSDILAWMPLPKPYREGGEA